MAGGSENLAGSSSAASSLSSLTDIGDEGSRPVWGRLQNSDPTDESPWARKIILSLGKFIHRTIMGYLMYQDIIDLI